MTAASVESIISGTLIFLTRMSRKVVMSAISLRSGSCRQTSTTCAPLAHLQPSDFRSLLELALRDQAFELAAAQHVGALADDHRTCIVVDHQRLDSRDDRAAQRRGNREASCPRPPRRAA